MPIFIVAAIQYAGTTEKKFPADATFVKYRLLYIKERSAFC
jgi:hypothetical protein